ncbi:MAG: 4Fe-4S dicluster domain-containing protein [Anaerolineae bacterium]|nr:4Fe-4S dicluster domain-containing protein [Anaerolineae bacterium]
MPCYHQLVERLNRFPQGAPPSDSLYKILRLLFSEEEAGLVAQLPIKPFTAASVSRIWKKDLAETRNILERLAGRALLVDMERPDGETTYVLPPPMAGFFEFSMMRVREEIDPKTLAELFYQYCTVEEAFMPSLFRGGETQQGRIYIQEPVLPPETHVLDYERASHVIQTASHIGVSTCYCRFKMQQLGKNCDAPQDICMTLNNIGHSLIRHGYAREVDRTEGLDLLAQAYESNLVQFGENAREQVSFICNCCGCCCEALTAGRRFGMHHPIHTTHYLPEVNEQTCNGCGKCVNVCPMEAMTLVSANDPNRPTRKKAKLDSDACLGCGVCVRNCPKNSIQMHSRPQRVIPPLNGTHRVVMMAIERGMLHNLIFDNQSLASHRILGAILGVILKLPPIKQALASQQVKSRYLEALLNK